MDNKENLLDQENDGLSIKDIIRFIKELFIFLRFHFWKILFFGIIGGLIGFYLALSSKPIYTAKVRFITRESGGSSALMSSLGSLGSLIGGASGSNSPMDRTLAILGSEKIIGAALFKTIYINGKPDLAINHLIDILELQKSWVNDSSLNGVRFLNLDTKIGELSFKKRKAYKIIISILKSEKASIIGKSFDKKSGIFDLNVNSVNEDFSIEFNKILYNELEKFIYNQSITASGKNIGIITEKIDSIKSELNGVQNSLARKTDRTLGLLMQEDKVDQKKLMIKEQMLTIMYSEAQRNLETFKFMNESLNAGLEVLEMPINPISPTQKSKIKFSILGFILSGFISFCFLYTIKWIKNQL